MLIAFLSSFSVIFFLLFLCFYFFSLSFVMPLSYGRYCEALYVEGNETEELLILHSIFISYFYYYFLSCTILSTLACYVTQIFFFVEISRKNCDAFILLFFFDELIFNVKFINVLIYYLFIFYYLSC